MPFDNENPPIAIRDIPLDVYNHALTYYGAPVAHSIEEAKAALMKLERNAFFLNRGVFKLHFL